jgi:hypothetical protein
LSGHSSSRLQQRRARACVLVLGGGARRRHEAALGAQQPRSSSCLMIASQANNKKSRALLTGNVAHRGPSCCGCALVFFLCGARPSGGRGPAPATLTRGKHRWLHTVLRVEGQRQRLKAKASSAFAS